MGFRIAAHDPAPPLDLNPFSNLFTTMKNQRNGCTLCVLQVLHLEAPLEARPPSVLLHTARPNQKVRHPLPPVSQFQQKFESLGIFAAVLFRLNLRTVYKLVSFKRTDAPMQCNPTPLPLTLDVSPCMIRSFAEELESPV